MSVLSYVVLVRRMHNSLKYSRTCSLIIKSLEVKQTGLYKWWNKNWKIHKVP